MLFTTCLKRNVGGYVESKRLVMKEELDETMYKWKVQGLSGSDKLTRQFSIFDYVKKYSRDFRARGDYEDAVFYLDNSDFRLGISFYPPDDRLMYNYFKNKAAKNYTGPVAIFRIHIPKNEVFVLNPHVKEESNGYTTYYLVKVNKNTVAEYSPKKDQWSVTQTYDDSADTFNVIYKPSRASLEVFHDINDNFTGNMDLDEFANTYFSKLKLEHSYNFNPYTD